MTDIARIARPTVYKGVQMRSRTEAKCAAAFDRQGILWTYEPVCYANSAAQYLPDFVTADRVTVFHSFLEDKRWAGQAFWEIKWKDHLLEQALPKMAVIWDGSARLPLIAWVPDTRRAWAAVPSSVDLGQPANGWMFEANVTACALHGVVVQNAALGDGDKCWPCVTEALTTLDGCCRANPCAVDRFAGLRAWVNTGELEMEARRRTEEVDGLLVRSKGLMSSEFIARLQDLRTSSKHGEQHARVRDLFGVYIERIGAVLGNPDEEDQAKQFRRWMREVSAP